MQFKIPSTSHGYIPYSASRHGYDHHVGLQNPYHVSYTVYTVAYSYNSYPYKSYPQLDFLQHVSHEQYHGKVRKYMQMSQNFMTWGTITLS